MVEPVLNFFEERSYFQTLVNRSPNVTKNLTNTTKTEIRVQQKRKQSYNKIRNNPVSENIALFVSVNKNLNPHFPNPCFGLTGPVHDPCL
jgi:hypothetical protein